MEVHIAPRERERERDLTCMSIGRKYQENEETAEKNENLSPFK